MAWGTGRVCVENCFSSDKIGVQFSFKGVCSGIIRGSGRQTVGVVINFVAYCCCGLPLGIVLMFLVFHDVTGTKEMSMFTSY